jgi:putative NADH-flavin reductase
MNVTVIGVTGRTGRHLVRRALDAGHEVTTFTRQPAKMDLEHERLQVMEGDVQNYEEMEEAVWGGVAKQADWVNLV